MWLIYKYFFPDGTEPPPTGPVKMAFQEYDRQMIDQMTVEERAQFLAHLKAIAPIEPVFEEDKLVGLLVDPTISADVDSEAGRAMAVFMDQVHKRIEDDKIEARAQRGRPSDTDGNLKSPTSARQASPASDDLVVVDLEEEGIHIPVNLVTKHLEEIIQAIPLGFDADDDGNLIRVHWDRTVTSPTEVIGFLTPQLRLISEDLDGLADRKEAIFDSIREVGAVL